MFFIITFDIIKTQKNVLGDLKLCKPIRLKKVEAIGEGFALLFYKIWSESTYFYTYTCIYDKM